MATTLEYLKDEKIESLESLLKAANERIATLKADLADENEEIESLEVKVESLEEKIKDLEEEIEELESEDGLSSKADDHDAAMALIYLRQLSVGRAGRYCDCCKTVSGHTPECIVRVLNIDLIGVAK